MSAVDSTSAKAQFARQTPSKLLTPIGDLLAEPDETIDWLVEDRIPAGGTAIFAAKPKVGKSTTVRDLALSVARGDTWLGHQCHQGTVWYFAFEGRRRDVRAHFRMMGAQPSDRLHVFVGQAPADIVLRVRQLAAAERPALIIVDTMQRFLRAESTDDYAEMTKLLDAVIGIAQESGAAVVLLHHAGKADRSGIDSVLGSTAISGSADTVILLTRTERYRTISTRQRVGEDLSEALILLDETTGRVRLGGSRQTADVDMVADAILTTLRAATAPMTEPEIVAVVEARAKFQRPALRALVAREQVFRSGKGSKGNPYRYSVVRPCSLVPPIGWEQENNHPDSQVSSIAIEQDACSHTPTQEPGPGQVVERDPSDCLVCGRDACEDTTACLRQRSRAFADLEDLFGPFEAVRVERPQ